MASGRLILPYSEGGLQSNLTFAGGATLTVYLTGTGTLASLFADSGLSTPILNPQTANAAGAFYEQATVIWADNSQAYDCVLTFPDGETYTYSDIYLLGAQTNVSGFAPINSPSFTGVPTATTPATNDDSQKLATTAYVQNQGYAPIASPTFTGTPAAPTASPGTNSTQLATTAFVEAAITAVTAAGQFRNQQTSGSSSGETLTSGAWTTRTLNTSVLNTITGASLSGNQVSLPAGTYFVTVQASSHGSGFGGAYSHTLRVYNATASSNLVTGLSCSLSGANSNPTLQAYLQGAFTLSGTAAIEVDSWVTGTCSGGSPASSGQSEVYVDIFLQKVA